MSYIRTQVGTAAALNPKVVMSRQVKALLIAMNGRFDPQSYVPRVPGVQTVPAMLEALVKDGYARVLPYAEDETVGFVETKPTPLFDSPQTDDRRAVQEAVAVMTDFVMEHLPREALEIAFELESLTSVNELEGSLGAYESKIRHRGDAAAQHLARLKQMLHLN